MSNYHIHMNVNAIFTFFVEASPLLYLKVRLFTYSLTLFVKCYNMNISTIFFKKITLSVCLFLTQIAQMKNLWQKYNLLYYSLRQMSKICFEYSKYSLSTFYIAKFIIIYMNFFYALLIMDIFILVSTVSTTSSPPPPPYI